MVKHGIELCFAKQTLLRHVEFSMGMMDFPVEPFFRNFYMVRQDFGIVTESGLIDISFREIFSFHYSLLVYPYAY